MSRQKLSRREAASTPFESTKSLSIEILGLPTVARSIKNPITSSDPKTTMDKNSKE
jgi:hypothetical protein